MQSTQLSSIQKRRLDPTKAAPHPVNTDSCMPTVSFERYSTVLFRTLLAFERCRTVFRTPESIRSIRSASLLSISKWYSALTSNTNDTVVVIPYRATNCQSKSGAWIQQKRPLLHSLMAGHQHGPQSCHTTQCPTTVQSLSLLYHSVSVLVGC